LKQRLDDDAEVYQLSGGIQRYLEAFPDGGLFEGTMHVFDRRGCVSGAEIATTGLSEPTSSTILGRCSFCQKPWDRYQGKWKCQYCALLVLVCPNCQGRHCRQRNELTCELCEVAQNSASRSLGEANVRPLPIKVDVLDSAAAPSTSAATAPEAGVPKRLDTLAERLAALTSGAFGLNDASSALAAVTELCDWLGSRRLRERVANDIQQLHAVRDCFDSALAAEGAGGPVAVACMEAIDRLLRDSPLRLRVYRGAAPLHMANRMLDMVRQVGSLAECKEWAISGRATALRILWRLMDLGDARQAIAHEAELWNSIVLAAYRAAVSEDDMATLREGFLLLRAGFSQRSLRDLFDDDAATDVAVAVVEKLAIDLSGGHEAAESMPGTEGPPCATPMKPTRLQRELAQRV